MFYFKVVFYYFNSILAKPVIDMIKQCRLQISDFETLEVIGRGAFGEVKVKNELKLAGIYLKRED